MAAAFRIWEFAEYHHALAHVPLGTKYLVRSAAAAILAHIAMRHGPVSGFL